MGLTDAILAAAADVPCPALRVDVHALVGATPHWWWAEVMWDDGSTVEVGPFPDADHLADAITEVAQEG